MINKAPASFVEAYLAAEVVADEAATKPDALKKLFGKPGARQEYLDTLGALARDLIACAGGNESAFENVRSALIDRDISCFADVHDRAQLVWEHATAVRG